jgi:tRNA A-37 threonylcarbamoyl transferase component Bud32
MAPELHRRLRELFEQAILLPEEQQQAFLEAQCKDKPELLATAARLVAAHAESRQFLSRGSNGKRYGRYLVVRELGRGSMAIVYEADDPAIGRKVALKVLRIESLDDAKLQFLKERMFREAQSGGMLSHPGIVTVFDVGQHGDETFIAMELVEGQTLHELLEANSSPDWKKAVAILRQCAAALDYAHQRGVVHRDIKPANIMIDRHDTVKIADFGVAKINAPQLKTVTGFVFGTPAYMSPEQIQMRKLDGRSDQFALAVVAYQMCTGAAPFRADSIASLAHQIVYEEPAPASLVNPRLSKAVDSALRRGLAKDPAQRYRSCAEMAGALDLAMNQAPAAPRRTKPLYWIGAGVAVLLLAGGVIAYRSGMPALHSGASHPPVAATPVAERPAAATSVPAQGSTQPAIPPPAKPEPGDSVQRRKEVYAEAVAARNSGQVQKAATLFEQAARLGEVKAMLDLGEFLAEGDHPDYANARLWFQRAADNGNTSAMVHLGAMYQWAIGVTEDAGRAVYWYNRGVQGHNAQAMYNLGGMYLDGRRMPLDVAKAKELFRGAAALGDVNAKARLAALEHPGK